MKALLAGWFSFELMGATAGDLITRDLVADWLRNAGVDFDVANAPPFTGGVDWAAADPAAYDAVVFVCGPFGDGPPVDEMMQRFSACRWLGLNLSMLDTLANFNPFELLLERDSDQAARPDLVFLGQAKPAPIVGVVLVHPQKEYGNRALHTEANAAFEALLAGREAARVPIDTRLDLNAEGLRTEAEIETLIARMDVVVTTRLHGSVLALKHGVPVVPIDPIAGGAKITRQMATVGWPYCFRADALDPAELEAAFIACLTDDARAQAAACASAARQQLAGIEQTFIDRLAKSPSTAASKA